MGMYTVGLNQSLNIAHAPKLVKNKAAEVNLETSKDTFSKTAVKAQPTFGGGFLSKASNELLGTRIPGSLTEEMKAAEDGDFATLEQLLGSSLALINKRQEGTGETALMKAYDNASLDKLDGNVHYSCCYLIAKRGADLNRKDEDGRGIMDRIDDDIALARQDHDNHKAKWLKDFKKDLRDISARKDRFHLPIEAGQTHEQIRQMLAANDDYAPAVYF